MIGAVDFVIVDTPGSDTYLSRLAHTWADTLLTPLNDSFIDLDLLARVDPDTLKIVRPSIYAEAVWKQRQLRAVQGGRPVDWVVMRNRLSSLAARNKRDMGTVIEALARRIGFRIAAGLSERVIYKELFLNGLTLLDLKRGSGRAVADVEPRRGAPGSARPRGRAQSAATRCGRAIGRARDSSQPRQTRKLQDEQGRRTPRCSRPARSRWRSWATGRRSFRSPTGPAKITLKTTRLLLVLTRPA